jgi:hypothetical protein
MQVTPHLDFDRIVIANTPDLPPFQNSAFITGNRELLLEAFTTQSFLHET